MSEQSAENVCSCGRGPGHVRIKTTGCIPSAENDRPADYVTARPRPTDAERATIMRAIGAARARRPIPPALEKQARCGATFEHDWHAFQGEKWRHVCDGVPRDLPPGSADQ